MSKLEYKSIFGHDPYDLDIIKKYELTKLPKILNKIEDEKTRQKILEIFYNGECEGYNLEGVCSKDNAYLDFMRRKNLIEIAHNDINAFKQIINNNINLFHGTNFNALPGIIKHGGMLSLNESNLNDNPVLTGEKWSRMHNLARNYISFTDQVDKALGYSLISPSTESTLASFGIMIGISSDDIKDLKTFNVHSDIPELGILDKLPMSKIKTIFAPNERIEFVSKIIGDAPIQVVPLDLISPSVDKVKYGQKDIENITKTRKTSGIKGIYEKVKESLKTRFNKENTKENGDSVYDR